jgi:hypothetical protein
MEIKTFNRYEEKYLISDPQKNELLSYFRQYCGFDPYCTENESYKTYNLYYDTFDNSVLRKSTDNPKFKEKLRLRSYIFPVTMEDMVFVEIKRKSDGRVNKRRISLSVRAAFALINEGVQPPFDDYESNQVLAEINYFLQMNKVIPTYFIRYQRIALTANDHSTIRITFDKDIVERTKDLSLTDDSGVSLLEEGQWLMEIKTERNFPLWLVDKLSAMELHSQSFSKVGNAYKYEIRGER